MNHSAGAAVQIVVLGSGSRGNCFAVVCDDAVLLIDAGFSARDVELRLARAGVDAAKIVAIALTHEHGDHAAGATRLATRHHAPIATSLGTWRALTRDREPCDFIPLGTGTNVAVGPFTLTACPTSHDAAEPIAVGVLVACGVSIGAAYDLGRPTQAVRWFLRERHCLILEANHDETLLRQSGYPTVVQQRIAGPGGHLSNRDAARLLDELHHELLETVILAHLSQRCNSHDVARSEISAALAARGFRGELHLAVQDGPMAPIGVHGPVQHRLFA